MTGSRIPGLYRLSLEERLKKVGDFAELTEEERRTILNGNVDIELLDKMIENVIGKFPLPLGIATNFLINDRDYLIPMAIEEPSVVAAASNAAKMARVKGGFHTSMSGSVMIGQIQITDVSDPWSAKMKILEHKEEIMKMCDERDPILVKFGGGARDVVVRVIDTDSGPMVITHLIIDTRDAMGANAVNTMAEYVAPFIENITGGRVYLRIISNLATHRLARARAVWDRDTIGGEEVVDGIVKAYHFAKADPYRCATHNKGVMNGISAVVIATGNDFRAVEAGVHSYAAITGKYQPITQWEKDENGDLVGTIEVPMAVGLVGGATKVHPTARANVKILGVKTANELAQVIVAVGLAQNFGALRALATEGIQRGHMELHARNVAATAGAKGDEVDAVASRMVKEKKINTERAAEILGELRKNAS